MTTKSSLPVVLSIAGSDSGGGAGIQADLKTFQALGCFGTTAVTAITCQNTQGVFGVQAIHTDIITGQIRAIMDDLPVKSVKTGMLLSAEIIENVSALLAERRKNHDFFLVVDPVMVAGSGDPLLEKKAEEALIEFLPQAYIITPNLPEAERLLRQQITDIDEMEKAAWQLYRLTGSAVLLKGGHLPSESDGIVRDIFCEGQNAIELKSQRIEGKNTHGTGCTLGAAIAAGLAHGLPLLSAIEKAREFVQGAIREAPGLGAGNGPLNHMWQDRVRIPTDSGNHLLI